MSQPIGINAQVALSEVRKCLETAEAKLFMPALADLRCTDALEQIKVAHALVKDLLRSTRPGPLPSYPAPKLGTASTPPES